MTVRKSNNQFGAIPVNAISDKRLAAADWRVLGAIARSDAFGKNGRHCYANQATIASWANVRRETANRSIAKLHDFGYVDIDRLNGRREYSVVYAKCAQLNTLGDDKCVPSDTPSVPGPTHINKETKYLQQSMKINSPKVRPRQACAPLQDNPQGRLAQIERHAKERGFITETQRQELAELEELAWADDHPVSNAIDGQIERIYHMVDHEGAR